MKRLSRQATGSIRDAKIPDDEMGSSESISEQEHQAQT